MQPGAVFDYFLESMPFIRVKISPKDCVITKISFGLGEKEISLSDMFTF